MVKSRSVDLDGKSWGDANTECIAHGASLASIHSDAAQDRLFNAIQAGALDVWIGLQANSNIYFFYNKYTKTQFLLIKAFQSTNECLV